MKKKTLEQVFNKAFYGKFKVHRATFEVKRGKLISKIICGAKSPKFSATYNAGVTCERCKAKLAQ